MDPLEFRLKNTSDTRMRSVLEAAAKRFGCKKAAVRPAGAVSVSPAASMPETYVAEIAEVRVDKAERSGSNESSPRRTWASSVNPEGATMQMEGCIMMGLGYALSEEIHFKGGQILTTNFHNYEVPRFSWMPEIEAILVKNDELGPRAAASRRSSPSAARLRMRCLTRSASGYSRCR